MSTDDGDLGGTRPQDHGPGADGHCGAPLVPEIIAVAPAMVEVLLACEHLARCDEPVLVSGETGCGKELISRRLHLRSARRQGPFVAVNCAAIPEELFEREFFGHAKSAYTGAATAGPGYVDRAAGGTLFLDEIGDMSLAMQPKLLRLLDNRQYYRVGDPQVRCANFRIIAATNADLSELVALRRFRPDLLYRLAGLEIRIPPLRKRRKDIMPLLVHFVEQLIGRRVDIADYLTQDELEHVCRYAWPGNVRELSAVARKLVWRKELPYLESGLRDFAASGAAATRSPARPEPRELTERLLAVGNNKALLARELGVARSTLYRWLRECPHRGGHLRREAAGARA